MAAAIARSLIKDDALGPSASKWIARSAGVGAANGSPATPEAVRAARRLGASLSDHRSQRLTADLIRKADLVLTMSPWHSHAARQIDPSADQRIIPLSPFGEIPDPIGQGQDTYDRTADELKWLIEWRLKQFRDGSIFSGDAPPPDSPPPRAR